MRGFAPVPPEKKAGTGCSEIILQGKAEDDCGRLGGSTVVPGFFLRRLQGRGWKKSQAAMERSPGFSGKPRAGTQGS
jgi:hypothetical protein